MLFIRILRSEISSSEWVRAPTPIMQLSMGYPAHSHLSPVMNWSDGLSKRQKKRVLDIWLAISILLIPSTMMPQALLHGRRWEFLPLKWKAPRYTVMQQERERMHCAFALFLTRRLLRVTTARQRKGRIPSRQ